MKKIVYLLSLCLFVFSCEKAESVKINEKEAISFGKEHNLIMDSFFSKYNNVSTRSSGIDITSIYENPEEAYDNIILSIKEMYKDEAATLEEVAQLENFMPLFERESFIKSIKNGEKIKAFTVDEVFQNLTDLSDEEKNSIKEIKRNMDSFFLGNITEAKLKSLLNNKKSKTRSSQSNTIERVSDIAFSSSIYWNDFFMNILQNSVQTRGMSDKDKAAVVDIAWADVCGAILGPHSAAAASLIAALTSIPSDTPQK
ncbi:MAG TPA: hypothetical protein DDZ96_02770 [Porphyromonadaceae bacterium]|jgi:hypothetical protein|nr:hypothetical protein [Porphyromonadaceae bacterium]HCM21495.1 hypothetical protein [Porphyromonadaceae bacterium]